MSERKKPVRRKELVTFMTAVGNYLTAVDLVMKEPSSFERGRKIGRLTNALELERDLFYRFHFKHYGRVS